MSKSPATIHSLNLLVKFSFVAIAGLVGQSALASCPIVNAGFDIKSLKKVTSTGKEIFFCKQDGFTPEQLSYKPSETELFSGGSRAISQRNTVQTFPMNSSVSLAGFSVTGLPLNTLTRYFPSSGGQYNKQSLFNFYTEVKKASECEGEYNIIKSYLKTNANTFAFTFPIQQVPTFTPGNDPSIGIFNNVKLATTVGTDQLTANVEIYHTNPGSGQYFTVSRNVIYCWLGVGTKLSMNNSDFANSGDFHLLMGVNTK